MICPVEAGGAGIRVDSSGPLGVSREYLSQRGKEDVHDSG